MFIINSGLRIISLLASQTIRHTHASRFTEHRVPHSPRRAPCCTRQQRRRATLQTAPVKQRRASNGMRKETYRTSSATRVRYDSKLPCKVLDDGKLLYEDFSSPDWPKNSTSKRHGTSERTLRIRITPTWVFNDNNLPFNAYCGPWWLNYTHEACSSPW